LQPLQAGIQFGMWSPTATDNPLLNFVLRDMSTHVELKTWQMMVTASLGSLAVTDHCGGVNKVNLMVAAGQIEETGGRDEMGKEGERERFMEAVYKKVSRGRDFLSSTAFLDQLYAALFNRGSRKDGGHGLAREYDVHMLTDQGFRKFCNC